jgi:hypothetical protein
MSIFMKKTKTVGTVSEFMSGEWKLTKNDKQTLAALAAAPVVTIFKSDQAAAGWIGDRIKDAFDPIIDLVQGVSYPVCFLMLCGGFLLVMIGQKHRGMTMIKWAAIGYVGMQLAPALMDILVDIGRAMKGEA